MKTREESPPDVCGKCGRGGQLSLENQRFYYRTILGWIGLMFGITYQFVWTVKIYFCRSCRAKIRRNALVSRWSFFAGILAMVIFLYLAINSFPDFGKMSIYFPLAVVSIVAGFFARAVLQSLGAPKTVRISRYELVIRIPNYGDFDFTKGVSLES